nr:VIT and VWA domain-containing protein [Pseudenhygromyxa sp. WMMC2535]
MAGGQAQPLSIQRQNVRVVLDEQLAETAVEQVFFNPAASEVEGYYWFTVPEDALIVGFALEVEGELIEAEVVERKQASARFEAAIERQVDPALLEWIDARTVRARIYPIPAAGTRRIVLRYQQLIARSEGKLRYRYPMAAPSGREAATIEDFALEVELRGELVEGYSAATRSEARIEGKDRSRVTMRRSGFVPRADFELELREREDRALIDEPALRVDLLQPGRDQADYLMLRWLPDARLDLAQAEVPRGEVVVVVDTSAGSDPGEHQAKLAVAEALLRSLSADDRFALVGADLRAEVLFPEDGLSAATPEAISEALEALAERGAGGATDLGATFEESLERVYGLEQPAIVYIGDALATSGELGGEALAERLQRSMAGASARLFTVGVGREVDEALLRKLAEVGGGRSLRVEEPSQAVLRALELSGALKTPTITELEVELGKGMSQVFSSAGGKLSRGEELVVLARTHDELPETLTIRGRFAGEAFSHEFSRKLAKDDGDRQRYVVNREGLIPQVVPRLWARAYVDSLLMDNRGPEAVRGKVLALGYQYGLMTPFTSFLALESESAYARAGIERRAREFPRLTDASWVRGRVGEAERGEERWQGLSTGLSVGGSLLGCSLEDAAEDAAESARERREGGGGASELDHELGRSSLGPAPSAAPVRGRLETKVEADAGLGWEGQAPEPESAALDEESKIMPRARGVFRFDVDAVEDARGVVDGEVSMALTTVPKWVREGTSAELLRRRYRGQVRFSSSGVEPLAAAACSDASTRGLGTRRNMWARQLDRQSTMNARLRAYEVAVATCEIQRWREQKAFLELLAARARTEEEIRQLLGHFSADEDALTFLSQALLRRLVDPGLIAAVVYAEFGSTVDWYALDGQLLTTDDPKRRIQLIDQALLAAPGDPDGERRMIAELVAQGRRDEAISRGLSLRDQGLLTSELVVVVGELLVDAGREDEARRLYSEIVEYAPDSVANRSLLGDLFLRHGWFADAYRQYERLMDIDESADAAIRLARAAAGTGRTDEALRLLERVYAGEGRPGADDPRRWARVHAAVILADLLRSDLELPRAKLEAELRALNLFEGASTWELLVWDELGADLVLVPEPGAPAQLASDRVDAKGTGLYALQPGGDAPLVVRHAGLVPARAVSWRRISLRWDGEAFSIDSQSGSIAAQEARAETDGDGDGAGEDEAAPTDDP